MASDSNRQLSQCRLTRVPLDCSNLIVIFLHFQPVQNDPVEIKKKSVKLNRIITPLLEQVCKYI